MEFCIELFDDEEFKFFERHKVVNVEAVGVNEAMEQAYVLYPDPWMIAQVSRKFEGPELGQPVFDGMNGMMYTVESINTAVKYSDLVHAKHLTD